MRDEIRVASTFHIRRAGLHGAMNHIIATSEKRTHHQDAFTDLVCATAQSSVIGESLLQAENLGNPMGGPFAVRVWFVLFLGRSVSARDFDQSPALTILQPVFEHPEL